MACRWGLSAEVDAEWSLREGVPVAAGLIDAHAGGEGTVGAWGRGMQPRYPHGLCDGYIGLHNRQPGRTGLRAGRVGYLFCAIVPDQWLAEGGQSAAGAALDHLVTLHAVADVARAEATAQSMSLTAWLGMLAMDAPADASEVASLADSLHVVPEFPGNRAPFADPDARAVIKRLGMGTSLSSLVVPYVAGVLGLGYGCR